MFITYLSIRLFTYLHNFSNDDKAITTLASGNILANGISSVSVFWPSINF